MTSTIKNICVYCGSAARINDRYKRAAHDLGAWIADHGYRLVYGGASVGMMGHLADGALAKGGKVIGVITHYLKDREIAHEGLSEQVTVSTMHERKMMMAGRADAFIIMPGGLGTLDETFEVLTLRQIHLHHKPVLFYNLDGFWNPLFTLARHMADQSFMLDEHMDMFVPFDSLVDLPKALESARSARRVDPMQKWR